MPNRLTQIHKWCRACLWRTERAVDRVRISSDRSMCVGIAKREWISKKKNRNMKNEIRNSISGWLGQTFINEFHWPRLASSRIKCVMFCFAARGVPMSMCIELFMADYGGWRRRIQVLHSIKWSLKLIFIYLFSLDRIYFASLWFPTNEWEADGEVKTTTAAAAATTKSRTIPFMNDWMRDGGPCVRLRKEAFIFNVRRHRTLYSVLTLARRGVPASGDWWASHSFLQFRFSIFLVLCIFGAASMTSWSWIGTN